VYLGAFFAAAWPAAATAWRAVPASAEASVAALEDQLRRLQRQGQQGVGGGGGASANCMGPTGQPDAARNQATAAWHTTARTGARDRVQVAGRLRVRQDDGARGPRKRNRELYNGLRTATVQATTPCAGRRQQSRQCRQIQAARKLCLADVLTPGPERAAGRARTWQR
jgi:hypothetical protein